MFLSLTKRRGISMRYSGIGGQAVMEGVMMKNKEPVCGGSPQAGSGN